MIEAPHLEMDFPLVTDGDIAVINLESARQQSWTRFWQAPRRPGIAEYIVEQEHLTAQFLGNPTTLDRLELLLNQLDRVDPESPRTALIHAQVLSMGHRFAEARRYLTQSEARGMPSDAVNCLSLSIDQACGKGHDRVLEARRQVAGSGRLEDMVPLGALLADLRDFEEADRVYRRALREYQGVSPFAAAWVCFQLGILWGELVPETEPSQAAQWYQRAVEYLPSYVKARVHLAEIYSRYGRNAEAEALLSPAISSGDPEACWRLSDVMLVMGKLADARVHMKAARSGFEVLLDKHLLAYADHGAEFYSGSGNNAARALELASINLANRPTLRAFEQAYAAAVGAGESGVASEILIAAEKGWAGTPAFRLSPLALAAAAAATSC